MVPQMEVQVGLVSPVVFTSLSTVGEIRLLNEDLRAEKILSPSLCSPMQGQGPETRPH